MAIPAMIICIASVIVAAAVPYMMLRSRTEDAKFRFYSNLFRSLNLDEGTDSAGSKIGHAEARQREKGSSV